MPKHRVLSFKPQLRLEWRGQDGRNRAARSFRQLRRFHHVINSDKVFGTHRFKQLAVGCARPLICFVIFGEAAESRDRYIRVVTVQVK
jgi:hypothetical protein